MINKILLLVAVIGILSCTPQGNEPPEPDCLPVDFSGTANWRIVGDSLYAESFTGEFVGNIAGRIVETDSGNTVFAVASGTFTAHYYNNLERTGYMSLQGLIYFDNGEYSTKLHVIIGMEGFKDVTGYFELIWIDEDKNIYHGGTLCFADAE